MTCFIVRSVANLLPLKTSALIAGYVMIVASVKNGGSKMCSICGKCDKCGKTNCYCYEMEDGKRVYNDYQEYCKKIGVDPVEHYLQGWAEEMALKQRVKACHRAGKLFLI